MKKYLILIAFLALPFSASASTITITAVVYDQSFCGASQRVDIGGTATFTNGDTDISFTYTNANLTSNGSFTGATKWQQTPILLTAIGTNTYVARVTNGNTVTATSETVTFQQRACTPNGGNPAHNPCGKFSNCIEAQYAGLVKFIKNGESGCNFFHGCVRETNSQKPTHIRLNYNEQGCNFFMGCIREL